MPDYDYDIALSYAGEDRRLVDEVAAHLKASGITCYYDRDDQADAWGKDLYVHLDEIYRRRARYCLMFVSKAYASKVWTRHERQSAQARALSEETEYLLPVRLDDSDIPGLLPTIGYLRASEFNPAQIADLVVRKVRAKKGGAAANDVGLFLDTTYLMSAPRDAAARKIGSSLLDFAKSLGTLQCAWAAVEPGSPGPAAESELTQLGFSLARARQRGQSDYAFLEQITAETVSGRVGTFVLATGDGAFLDKVMGLLVLGHPVHLVANAKDQYSGFDDLARERRKLRRTEGLDDDFLVHDLEDVLARSHLQ